jgi:hypothetical protein
MDLMIRRGPSLDAVIAAVVEVGGVSRAAINVSADDDAEFRVQYDQPFWAVVHDYAVGDIAWKVDFDGRSPRDYTGIARAMAERLQTNVVWPDESTLSPIAATQCTPDGTISPVVIIDIEDDISFVVGFIIRTSAKQQDVLRMATRQDGKHSDLVDGVDIPYRASFSHDDWTAIKLGLVPQAMEDKWFIFYEAPNLYLSRSWTGYTVFQLTFDEMGPDAVLLEALCARDVVSRSTASYQAQLLHWLIHNLLLGAAEPFPLPPGDDGHDGLYQHNVAGTACAETKAALPQKRWWQRLVSKP